MIYYLVVLATLFPNVNPMKPDEMKWKRERGREGERLTAFGPQD